MPPDQAHPASQDPVSRAIPPARHRDRSRTVTARRRAPRPATPAKPPGHQITHSHADFDESLVNYVTDVIDRHRGPVTLNLTALAFCDARGLAALVRMAGYADRKGCPFRLASPSPRLIKIMRITRLDRRFLTSRASALAPGEFVRPPDLFNMAASIAEIQDQ